MSTHVADVSIEATRWKTELAANAETATWHLLKSALRRPTSPRNSLGSNEPTRAVAPAAIGGCKNPTTMSKGNPMLTWSPRHAGTGSSSTNATIPAQRTRVGSNTPGFSAAKIVPPPSVGTITRSSNAARLRPDSPVPAVFFRVVARPPHVRAASGTPPHILHAQSHRWNQLSGLAWVAIALRH